MKALALAGCFLVLAHGGWSQDSKPGTDRNPEDFTLKNGLRVHLEPADIRGQVGVVLLIQGAGYFAELAGLPHVAHVTEHTIFFAGPPGGLERRLAEKLFNGRAGCETQGDFMFYALYPDPDDLDTAISVQAMRLLTPSIEPKLVERQTVSVVKEIERREDKKSKTDNFDPFPWCAFAHAVLHGEKDIPIKAASELIEASDVGTFHRRTFSPERAMLTIVGDFDPGPARKAVERSFASRGNRPEPESRPASRPATGRKSAATWDVASHRLFVAWPAPRPSDPAHPALTVFADVMRRMITFNPQTRTEIKQEPVAFGDVGGWFVISVEVRDLEHAGSLAKVITDLVHSTAGSHAFKNPLDRMDPAKERIRAGVGIPMDYPPAVAKHPTKITGYGDRAIWRMHTILSTGQSPEAYAARTDAVTREDIEAAVAKYLPADKATIVTIAGKE